MTNKLSNWQHFFFFFLQKCLKINIYDANWQELIRKLRSNVIGRALLHNAITFEKSLENKEMCIIKIFCPFE